MTGLYRFFMVALAFIAGSACGSHCQGYVEKRLGDGIYLSTEGGISLEVDRDGQRVVLRDEGRVVERRFRQIPRDERPLRCMTQASGVRVEVLDLGPEVLEFAGRRFPHPMIEATCGKSDGAVIVDRDSGVDEVVFAPAPPTGSDLPPSGSGHEHPEATRVADGTFDSPETSAARPEYLVWLRSAQSSVPETIWVVAGPREEPLVAARQTGLFVSAAETLWRIGTAHLPVHEFPCDEQDRIEDPDFVRRIRSGPAKQLMVPVAEGVAGKARGRRWLLDMPHDVESSNPAEEGFESFVLPAGAAGPRSFQFTGGSEGVLWFVLEDHGGTCDGPSPCVTQVVDLDTSPDEHDHPTYASLAGPGSSVDLLLHQALVDNPVTAVRAAVSRLEARILEFLTHADAVPAAGIRPNDHDDHTDGEPGFDAAAVRLAQVWQVSGGGLLRARLVLTYPEPVPPSLDGPCATPHAFETAEAGLPMSSLQLGLPPREVREALARYPGERLFGWSTVDPRHRDAMFEAFRNP